MRLHFRSDLVGACLPQTLLRTDEEELCQFDTIPPTYREKQSVLDGECPIVHIAIVCGLWQGASYSGTHPVFILSLHRLFEIPPAASPARTTAMQQPQHGRGAQQADEQQHHTGNGADNGRRVDGLFYVLGVAHTVKPRHQHVDAVAQVGWKRQNGAKNTAPGGASCFLRKISQPRSSPLVAMTCLYQSKLFFL